MRLGETLSAAARALPRLWRGACGAIVLAVVIWSLKPLAAGPAGLIWAACALASTLVLAGARLVAGSPFMRLIAGLLLLYVTVNTILYYQQAAVVAAVDAGARALVLTGAEARPGEGDGNQTDAIDVLLFAIDAADAEGRGLLTEFKCEVGHASTVVRRVAAG